LTLICVERPIDSIQFYRDKIPRLCKTKNKALFEHSKRALFFEGYT